MKEMFFGIVYFIAGGLGAMLFSYYREKGRNLATKEDIKEITSKIEQTKLVSSDFVNKKIIAFDDLGQVLANVIIYCSKARGYQNEHWVSSEEMDKKSTFQKADEIYRKVCRYHYIIPENIRVQLSDFMQEVFTLGVMEMHSKVDPKTLEPKEEELYTPKLYKQLESHAQEILDLMYKDLYFGD